MNSFFNKKEDFLNKKEFKKPIDPSMDVIVLFTQWKKNHFYYTFKLATVLRIHMIIAYVLLTVNESA